MRWRVVSVALLFLLSSITMPARAFAPPWFTPVIVGTAGLIGWSAVLTAMGVIGYIELRDAMNNAVRVPLGAAPSAQPAAPSAPATAVPVSGGTIPVAMVYSAPDQCGVGGTYSNPADACGHAASSCRIRLGYDDYDASYSGTWDGSQCIMTRTLKYLDGSPAGTSSYVVSISSWNGCPNGYTQSGSTCSGGPVVCPDGYVAASGYCNLSNARQAVSDKKCDIALSNGAFAMAADLDCPATVDGQKLSPMIRDGRVVAYGTNSSGQPLMFEVIPGTQTTVKVHEQVQADTATVVKTTTLTADPATSAITSVAVSSAPGSISAPSSASVPATASPTAENTPQVSTRQASEIVFPTDYARTGEAAQAANTIKTAIEGLKAAPDVDNPGLITPTLNETKGGFYGESNQLLGLLGWIVPAHSSQCPTASLAFDWKVFAWSGTFDGHCTIAEQVRGTAALIFDLLWILAAFFIVLGA